MALGARRVDKLEEIVGKIRADGGEAIAVHLDVTDPDSVKACVEQTTSELGDIEVLVAGAGDTYFGKLDSISTEQFESQVQIHLIGANRVATAVLPGMLERQRGDLIFVGSDVALRQRPHMGPTARPRQRWSRWSRTTRWSSRAPGCARPSCIQARRRRRWAGACRPT